MNKSSYLAVITKLNVMFVILLVWGLFLPTIAQEKRAMSSVDMLEIPVLNSPQLSPDGKYIIYILYNTDWKKNKNICHIWRIKTDGSGIIQLTNGEEENSPLWSPDGSMISFTAKRGEETENQVYLINNSGGEASRLSKHSTSVSNTKWSPDGKYIYFVAAEPKSEEEKNRDKLKNDVFAFDENFKQNCLWRISVADKKEERITSADYSVLGYEISGDGKMIVFQRCKTPLVDDADKSEIWLMNSDGTNESQVTKNNVAESGAQLSPDNKKIIFTSGCNDKFEPYYNSHLFIVNTDGTGIRMLLPEMPYAVNNARWSKDGSKIYFVANTGVRSNLFEAEIASGQYKQLTKGDHAFKNWSYAEKPDQHVFTLDDESNPGDVWIFNRGINQEPLRVTHVFDYLKEKFLLPHKEAVQWKGTDGVTVEGILTYPINYEKGESYPLVVNAHGGPALSIQFGFGDWSVYEQVLAGMRYASLRPNYRGSAGYGDTFIRDMVGHYFNNAHLDVLAGVDYLINRGIADSSKLAMMGWSAGGHMTNKLITYTDRFKAAASTAGAVDWISMYAQTDMRTYRAIWFEGTPWQKNAPLDNYLNNSPLKDISNVKTPTLIFVGENDPRVPAAQSVELYRALKSNGVNTRLYMAPREYHGWNEPLHRLFKMNAELEWFEKYVNNREFKWEKAPESEPVKKE